MSDEEADNEDFENDHEWDAYQEAIRDQLQKDSEDRFKRMPAICRKCRWLDWYYLEDCNMRLRPVNGKCVKFCRDYGFVYHLPSKMRLWWWQFQARLWDIKQQLIEKLNR